MKNIAYVFAALIALTSCASAAASVTVVANSIDLFFASGYVDNLKASGMTVTTISAADLHDHKEDPNIFILGGGNAPEGIGELVSGLLTREEMRDASKAPDGSAVVVIANLWASKQRVVIFAGYEKEETRKAFASAQGDLMKSLRFDESAYPQSTRSTNVSVPEIDETQPYTDITAYEAYAIMNTLQNAEVLDVRGKSSYEAGHIPGAVNMPVRELELRISSLGRHKTYILYCGGNSESIKAGEIMAKNGYTKVYRIVDGYMAWRKAGYAKDVTASSS